MTQCFTCIFIGAFSPIYVGIQTSFSHYVDDGHVTLDCRVEIDFDQSSHASHHDENLMEGSLVMLEIYKRSCKYISHLFNVLFLFASGGIPSI